VVDEANAIGTTYLRAQTLAEPIRTGSLERLVRYTDTSIRLSRSVPGSPAARQAAADGQQLQRQLWALAGQALDAAPTSHDQADGAAGGPVRHGQHGADEQRGGAQRSQNAAAPAFR
jgi:hypothetical protein